MLLFYLVYIYLSSITKSRSFLCLWLALNDKFYFHFQNSFRFSANISATLVKSFVLGLYNKSACSCSFCFCSCSNNFVVFAALLTPAFLLLIGKLFLFYFSVVFPEANCFCFCLFFFCLIYFKNVLYLFPYPHSYTNYASHSFLHNSSLVILSDILSSAFVFSILAIISYCC